ncbi:MAG: IclR family transcriptional regulator [Chloroflexota bacterium]
MEPERDASERDLPLSSVQSVARAFDVLRAVADEPAGVTEVAARTGLAKSTAQRMLVALAAAGAVERTADGRWRVGPVIAALAAGPGSPGSLIAAARPVLVALAAATGEAAGLAIEEDGLVRYLDQAESVQPVVVRDWTGTCLPMHPVSSGRVLLAALAAPALARALASPRERFTERTVTDADALRAILAAVRRDGVAWTADEYLDGITSVAAPVAGPAGEVVAAIHLHGPSYRFPGERARAVFEDAVRDAAARVAARLRAG